MDLMETTAPRSMACSPSRLFLGGLVIVVGMTLVADRQAWSGVHLNVPIWAWILVFLGLAKLGEWRASGRPWPSRSAVALLFFGMWALLNEYRLFGVSYRRTWPILLVGAGVLMVLRSQDPMAASPSSDGR